MEFLMAFKRLIFILLSLIILAGCTNQKKVNELQELTAQLEAERTQLLQEAAEKSDFLEEYTQTINEVYDNLERIRKREGFLIKVTRDVEEQDKAPLKDKMLANIKSIDTYLKSSKNKLFALRKKVKKSTMQTSALNAMIEKLQQNLDEREQHIVELKNQIDELNVKYSEAEFQMREKDQIIARQASQLKTVYYIIGSEKELKKKGIIVEKGGLLGLRKTKKLAAGFDEKEFLTADISELNALSIDQKIKKVKVISPHNPNSYHLVKKDDKQTVLEIIDPQEFWKIKYLVIIANS